jgi:hypothetical protein
LEWANITIDLEISSQPESIGLEFICNGTKYGDSTPGAFDIKFQCKTGMLVVPDGADCSFIVKGNHSDDGRFMAYYGAYYGHSHNEDMLLVNWSFASIGSIMALFTVSIPHVVSLTSCIHHNASTYPIKLRLDIDDSDEALEMVKV